MHLRIVSLPTTCIGFIYLVHLRVVLSLGHAVRRSRQEESAARHIGSDVCGARGFQTKRCSSPPSPCFRLAFCKETCPRLTMCMVFSRLPMGRYTLKQLLEIEGRDMAYRTSSGLRLPPRLRLLQSIRRPPVIPSRPGLLWDLGWTKVGSNAALDCSTAGTGTPSGVSLGHQCRRPRISRL